MPSPTRSTTTSHSASRHSLHGSVKARTDGASSGSEDATEGEVANKPDHDGETEPPRHQPGQRGLPDQLRQGDGNCRQRGQEVVDVRDAVLQNSQRVEGDVDA